MTRPLTRRPDMGRLGRFLTAAGVVVAVQAAIVIGLIAVGVNAQIALILGIGVSMIVHFTVNRQWVFSDEGDGFHFHLSRQGVAYLLLALFNYVVSALALAFLPAAFGVTTTVVYAGTTLLLGANNYLWLGQFVFRRAG